MAEGVKMRCVKYLLFVFNLMFFISGILIISFGVLILTAFRQFFSLGQSSDAVAKTFIVLGAIIFIISFIGCFGIVCEHYFLIVAFVAFLSLVFVLEVAAAIAAFTMKNKIKDAIEVELNTEVQKYFAFDPETLSWDSMQSELDCCGASNYSDWQRNSYLNGSVPVSCCIDSNNCNIAGLSVVPEQTAELIIYTNGCVDGMINWFTRNILIIGGIATGFTLLQIVGIILASCLAWGVRKESSYF